MDTEVKQDEDAAHALLTKVLADVDNGFTWTGNLIRDKTVEEIREYLKSLS